MLLLLTQLAAAELPLPSYRDAIARVHWHDVNARIENACTFDGGQAAWVCDTPTVERALEDASAFSEQAFEDAGITYLLGYGNRVLGRAGRAERHYARAVALDPEYETAWYDLGELQLAHGQLAEAERAFTEVARLRAEGPNAWVGPWRLAEVAAHRHDPAAFERHMKEALRRGFSFRQIAGLPNWQAFYADPAMTSSIEKLLTVYGSPEIIESLKP